jgi:hypothetical protein
MAQGRPSTTSSPDAVKIRPSSRRMLDTSRLAAPAIFDWNAAELMQG